MVARCRGSPSAGFVSAAGPPAAARGHHARRYTGRAVSILGWGTHSLAPLSFRGASYSGVFTLLPLLTGHGRSHQGEILRQAAGLAEAGALRPRLHDESFSLTDVAAAHEVLSTGRAHGRVIVTVSSDG